MRKIMSAMLAALLLVAAASGLAGCHEPTEEFVSDYQESNSWGSVLQKANTSYMFNYEGAPNEGYFFINDFERGGKIEKTPYDPQREGYVFAGWYREPECINVWNFEQDTLPAAEHDENGELIYTETKLYAKWVQV